MALTVETGAIVAGAESYISVSDANTYHNLRRNIDWLDMNDAEKESALRKATDYMIQRYSTSWKGGRVSSAQVLDWPRLGATVYGFALDSDIVPDSVKYACAELALKSYSEALNPDKSQGVVREKVDVIEIEYDKSSPQNKRFAAIDSMLSPYLKYSGSSAMLLRA